MATPHTEYTEPRWICKNSSSLDVLGSQAVPPLSRASDGTLLFPFDEAVNQLSGILELSSRPTGLLLHAKQDTRNGYLGF